MEKNSHDGYWGLTLIAASFLSWLFPATNPVLLFFHGFFYLGNILLFDYVSHKFSGVSVLHSHYRRMHFLVWGALYGLILELYAHWLGKLWYYPHWSNGFYVLILVPGFAVYLLYLLETYLGVKALLEHFWLKSKKTVSFKGLKSIFTGVGLFGAVGLSALTTFIFLKFPIASDPVDLFSVNFAAAAPANTAWIMLAVAVCIWLVLEFIEYQKHETSMLYEMIKGNWWPVAAVFLSAWMSALVYEFLNLPGGLWRYANWPAAGPKILGLSIVVYLAWPFHYFPAFSLYRILYKKESEKLWE